ncbi:hypothetical protein BDW59DRAFT_96288 [Aspergillus cavernicola]|uniref:Uncharacterized protein n=1 Tax=Aspergillus cavernicola TaxID=176166 RepID=A0ABR4I9T9_9EURO
MDCTAACPHQNLLQSRYVRSRYILRTVCTLIVCWVLDLGTKMKTIAQQTPSWIDRHGHSHQPHHMTFSSVILLRLPSPLKSYLTCHVRNIELVKLWATSHGNISGVIPSKPSSWSLKSQESTSSLNKFGRDSSSGGQVGKSKSPLTGSLFPFLEISQPSAAYLRLSRTIPPRSIEDELQGGETKRLSCTVALHVVYMALQSLVC